MASSLRRTVNVVWDLERYKFFLEGKYFDSIHPSLKRQSTLNMSYGLYEVIPGFYQVRGFDLANITFVKGDTGWIVFDPLTAPETAAAAKKLVDEHLGGLPGVAVAYSHSQVDHWGGVRGIVDEADVQAGKVDQIVVYKIDRLTRALTDFARIVEQFERHWPPAFVIVVTVIFTGAGDGRGAQQGGRNGRDGKCLAQHNGLLATRATGSSSWSTARLPHPSLCNVHVSRAS